MLRNPAIEGTTQPVPLAFAAAEKSNLYTVECSPTVDRDWNRRATQFPEARLQQTCEAAQIRRRLEGSDSLFFSIRCNAEIVGQLFVARAFIHPDLLQWCRPVLRHGWLKRAMGAYRWFGGPLIFDKSAYTRILQHLLAAVEERAAADRIFAIKDVAPPFYDPEMDAAQVDEIYREFGYAGEERATIALNLEADLEALWKNLSREARQKVNKARKQDIRIVEADTEERLLHYYQVRVETARRSGVRPPSVDSVLAAESIYMKSGMAKVFLAEHEGNIASGQMLALFNGNIQLGGVCYSDYARTQSLHANDLMQWHVIEWGHTQHYRTIDWAGYGLAPACEKEVGINRFKAKWGGTVIPYNVYSKIYGTKRHNFLVGAKAAARKFGLR